MKSKCEATDEFSYRAFKMDFLKIQLCTTIRESEAWPDD